MKYESVLRVAVLRSVKVFLLRSNVYSYSEHWRAAWSPYHVYRRRTAMGNNAFPIQDPALCTKLGWETLGTAPPPIVMRWTRKMTLYFGEFLYSTSPEIMVSGPPVWSYFQNGQFEENLLNHFFNCRVTFDSDSLVSAQPYDSPKCTYVLTRHCFSMLTRS